MAPPTESQPGQTSLQAKKLDVVRREIWHAAMNLFYAQGFDQTTIEQIAKQAQVSRRTFFRYFSSKEDVMATAIKGYGNALAQALVEQPLQATPLEASKAVVKIVARKAIESPYAELALQIVNKSPSARSAQLLELPVIEDELARIFAGRIKLNRGLRLAPRILANVTLSITTLSIFQCLENRKASIDEVVDEAFFCMNWICLPETPRKK